MYIQDSQLKGLYQRERTTGNKWVVKAKQRGINKPVTITLGRVEVIPVRDARRLAREKLSLLALGINPNTQAKQSRAISSQLCITLRDALEEYLSLRKLKPSTEKSYRQVIARAFTGWLDKPLRDISRRNIVKRYQEIQEGIARRKKQPEKANPRGLAEAQKAMRYLSAIMNSYAKDTLKGQPVLPDGNTVLVLKDKRARVKLKPRKRFLNPSERSVIYKVIQASRESNNQSGISQQQGDFVLLLLTTGMRFDEARLLKWKNITEDTYTITDTKNGRDHTLPMTSSVSALFKRNRTDSEWVFPGREDGPASMSTAIKKVVVESGVSFTAHDLRRTAATVAAEHGFSRDQIGRLLNHSVSNVTEAYIQKTAVALMPILEAIEQDILGA